MAAHPHAPYPAGTFMYPYQGFDLAESGFVRVEVRRPDRRMAALSNPIILF